MISNILTVAQQVLILFVLIGIGFLTNKKKLVSAEGIKGMTDLMLYVVTPAVIINSFNRTLDMNMLKGLGLVFAFAILIHIISIFAAMLLVHDKDKKKEQVLRAGMVLSNCGYMSFPLQQAILGNNGVFYGTAYVVVLQLFVWTWMESMMSGVKGISIKKILFNPGILGTAVGFVIFFSPITLPEFISKPVEYLAGLNTPVAMLIIGFHLADASLKIKGKNAYISMIYRLIISPIILIGIMLLFGIKGDVLIVCSIAASAPVAAIVTMFATRHNADKSLSAGICSLTTLLSILTMPVIVGIAQYISNM